MFNTPEAQCLTVFHDGSCALCRTEVAALSQSTEGVHWVDCAPTDFSPNAHQAPEQTALMQALHVRDAEGAWHIGVDAFAVLYANAGHTRLAALLRWPPTRFIARMAYPMVVRLRPYLAKQAWALWLVNKIASKT